MSQTTEEQTRLRFEFLKRKFLSYYKLHRHDIQPPSEIQRREFAFLMFRERFMVRHRGFGSNEEVVESIINLIPSDVYYSTAYYERPTLDMEKKGWLGSDLVFDVDADHIDTDCKKTHDMWTCNTCKKVSRGKAPKVCPDCKGTRIEERAWLCDDCLQAAKLEVMKLLDFLSRDFGIDRNDMRVFFSGHRGYHLHVTSPGLRAMNDEQRKEIVDYVLAIGMDVVRQGLVEEFARGTRIIHGPSTEAPGWPGRLAVAVRDLLAEASVEELMKFGFRKNVANGIVKSRQLAEGQRLADMIWMPTRGVSLETWKTVIANIVTNYPITAKIDTVVTTDIHRLIRLPSTLNGKTGFKACGVPIERLKEFDAFRDPAVLEGDTKVRVTEAPAFRIRDQTFGPFSNEETTLPTAAAVLLAAKGMATPVGD